MSIKDSEALVIKSYNLSEADRIVVFFTRVFGVVRGVAKGAKRLKSRFGSTLEPFSTVHLTFFQKEDRELVSIQSIELLQSRFATASDPEFLNAFSYIGDLLVDFAPPHAADETLYRMITACLASADDRADLHVLKLYFEVWLLRLSGYLPDWSRCESCKREIAATEGTALMPSFQLQCSECRRGYAFGEISAEDREVFHNVQNLSPTDFVRFAMGRPASIPMLSGILKRIIAGVLGREVATGEGFKVEFNQRGGDAT